MEATAITFTTTINIIALLGKDNFTNSSAVSNPRLQPLGRCFIRIRLAFSKDRYLYKNDILCTPLYIIKSKRENSVG
jgi:hypothetical protein